MEQYFASLSKQQTMLLLAGVTFGGNDCIEAFTYLEGVDAELLRHRAEVLLKIPKERRIPLLVQEIKKLVTARKRQLGSVEPTSLAAVLEGERGAVVEVMLRALPSALASAVRKTLGAKSVALKREVSAEVLSVIGWKLEEALEAGAVAGLPFAFKDLPLLKVRELVTLIDRMGARALGTALSGAPEDLRKKILDALPPDQRAMSERAAEAGAARALSAEQAQGVFDMYALVAQPSAGVRSAGVHRLAKAAWAEGEGFVEQLGALLPPDLKKVFRHWVELEAGKKAKGDGGRADIVDQLERLARRGLVDRPARPRPPTSSVRLPPPKFEKRVAPPKADLLPPLRAASKPVARDPRVNAVPQGSEKPVKKGPTVSPVLAAPPKRKVTVPPFKGPGRGPDDGSS